jgi:hypothetical protein
VTGRPALHRSPTDDLDGVDGEIPLFTEPTQQRHVARCPVPVPEVLPDHDHQRLAHADQHVGYELVGRLLGSLLVEWEDEHVVGSGVAQERDPALERYE